MLQIIFILTDESLYQLQASDHKSNHRSYRWLQYKTVSNNNHQENWCFFHGRKGEIITQKVAV